MLNDRKQISLLKDDKLLLEKKLIQKQEIGLQQMNGLARTM